VPAMVMRTGKAGLKADCEMFWYFQEIKDPNGAISISEKKSGIVKFAYR